MIARKVSFIAFCVQRDARRMEEHASSVAASSSIERAPSVCLRTCMRIVHDGGGCGPTTASGQQCERHQYPCFARCGGGGDRKQLDWRRDPVSNRTPSDSHNKLRKCVACLTQSSGGWQATCSCYCERTASQPAVERRRTRGATSSIIHLLRRVFIFRLPPPSRALCGRNCAVGVCVRTNYPPATDTSSKKVLPRARQASGGGCSRNSRLSSTRTTHK